MDFPSYFTSVWNIAAVNSAKKLAKLAPHRRSFAGQRRQGLPKPKVTGNRELTYVHDYERYLPRSAMIVEDEKCPMGDDIASPHSRGR
jgi:hypothetical protein